MLASEDVEESGRVVARAVVEGEGDELALARAVGHESGAAAGAAHRPHRSQAEEALAPRGQAFPAAPGAAAAWRGDDPPAVAVGTQAGIGRQQREHEVVGIGPLEAHGDRLAVRHLSACVEQLEAGAAVGVRLAAEAEAAAAVAPLAPQLQAEEAGVVSARKPLQSLQRDRRGRAQAEDQSPAGLGEARVRAARRRRRYGPCRRRQRGEDEARGERDARSLCEEPIGQISTGHFRYMCVG